MRRTIGIAAVLLSLAAFSARNLQTFGEGQVHWIKVRVDPKSNGVFSIEQRVVQSNL